MEEKKKKKPGGGGGGAEGGGHRQCQEVYHTPTACFREPMLREYMTCDRLKYGEQ